MALFGRECLPHRSTLSRFLAALGQAPVEALRIVFLDDLVARPLEQENKTGGLWDRQGTQRSEERRVGKEWSSLCDWSSDVCSSDLSSGRGVAHRVSRRPGRSPAGAGEQNGRAVGPTRNAVAGLRCGWHATSRSPARLALHP